MNTLPPEILAHIVDNIKEVQGWDLRLAQYSPISRAWKTSIERLTLQRLKITTDELDAFTALFSGESISRWANLTSMTVTFILPILPNPTGCCLVVQPPGREADGAVFSESVKELFTILADRGARAIRKEPLTLCFSQAYRLTEFEGPEATTWAGCTSIDSLSVHSLRVVLDAQAVSGQFELCKHNIQPCMALPLFNTSDSTS